MQRSSNCDRAFLDIVEAINSSGQDCAPTKMTSLRTGRPTKEIIAHLSEIENQRDRIVANDAKTLDLPVAVARFVWMMSASDRLADIAFYEPKVSGFTDDGVSVPGSSYGRRIRQSYPGIDQLAGAIARLKDDSAGSRRAAISIYQPTDTTRESNDIPCAFGLIYHGRGGRLHSTTIMRSNNAVGLLPFNLFEFSLLAEVVAVETGLELGPMHYFAGSMHFFREDFEKLSPKPDVAASKAIGEMPPMPSTPAPLEEIRKLIQLEAEMRQGSERVRATFTDEWRSKVQDRLSVYWQQFAFLLLLQIAKRNDDAAAFAALKSFLQPYYKTLIPDLRPAAQSQPTDSPLEQLFKPGLSVDDEVAPKRAAVKAKVIAFLRKHEESTGKKLGAIVAIGVQDEFVERLAARKSDGGVLDEIEFNEVLERFLKAQP